MRTRIRTFAPTLILWGVIALSTGCASLMPRLVPPTLDVTGVNLAGSDLAHTQISVQLHVTNPNARSLSVQGIDCTLALAGTQFAQGMTDAPFVVPASGETDFQVTLNADLATALGIMLGQLGAKDVPYTVTGQAHLAQGLIRTLPFRKEGRLALR
jgi:LEA14-like dessication related protein